MRLGEIYQMNIELQYICNTIIRASHIQNYDRFLRGIMSLSGKLRILSIEIDKYAELQDIVQNSNLNSFFLNLLDIEKNENYILAADLIEIQLLPMLESIQTRIRELNEVNNCDANWEYNIQKLREDDYELYGLLKAEFESWIIEETSIYILEPTNSGLYTMSSKDIKGSYYYHSNVNPSIEAFDFAREFYCIDYDSYILFGIGLGYHCEEIFKLDEGVKLTIFENDIKVILQAMMANKLDWLWNSDSVKLCYDPQFKGLSAALKSIGNNGRFIIHFPSLRHVEGPIRTRLENIFRRESGIRNMNILMESNFRSNVATCKKNVDELEEYFEGKKVIIVAAGPSLDKNIEQLKVVKDDTIVVAVSTVFRKLIANGIRIDYVIVADASKRVYGQIRGIESEKVPMLILSTAYRGFADKYSGEKYLILQREFNSSEKVAANSGNTLYSTGGSVITTIFDICIRFRCSSIAFIGLDLAYTDNLAHASGTSRRNATDIDDLPVVCGYYYSHDGHIVYENVISSHLFDMYRNWLENRIIEDDVTMPVYDATEGGSVINGFDIIKLKDYL